jgi:hypothetical protein
LKPFCPIGADAGAAAVCGWGCFWTLPQAPDLQSPPVVWVGVAVDGVFAISLIFFLLFVAVVERGRTPFPQETCQSLLRRQKNRKPLCRNGMRLERPMATPLRYFATWNISKTICEFSFFIPLIRVGHEQLR